MQEILQGTINIVSTTDNGLLLNSNCIRPFFSPNGRYIAFWNQDYNNITDVFLNTYHLYIKDIFMNILILVDTGNGHSPVLNDSYSYQASFSPDSSQILFLTTSTNLISADPIHTTNPDTHYRWYVKNIVTSDIQRVIEDNGIYGNQYDFAQALWYNNTNIVCVSFSNNLASVEEVMHSEVFIKDISTGVLTNISKSDVSFTTNSYNISIGSEKVAFFNNTLGYCYVTPFTELFQRVQLLPDMINYGIVSPDVLQWNTLGTQFIFRIQSGNTIPTDDNNAKDDFIYDLTNDTIIPINENSLYGNAESKQSKFSPDNLFVSFLTASSNIDPSADNDIVNLYIKEISTGIVTKISKTLKANNNYKLLQDVLGYNWIDENRIVYTTNDRVTNQDTNNTVDWVIYNIISNDIELINISTDDILNTKYNIYTNIRKDSFYASENKIVFSSILSKLNISYITPHYNTYNIFTLTFKNTYIDYPLPTGYSVPQPDQLYVNDSLNANIKNISSADIYSANDYLQHTSNIPTTTLSISASPYIERTATEQYVHAYPYIRWMSVKFPNFPVNTSSFLLGMGIFQSSPTLVSDVASILESNPNIINPVIGTLVNIDVIPKNDVALITSGDDQFIIVDSTIYLSATIIGNTLGHSFLWEQLSGNIVSITQNSITTAYCDFTESSTDSVFRFWIDKDKYNAQYQDLTIYVTPVSTIIPNITNSISFGGLY